MHESVVSNSFWDLLNIVGGPDMGHLVTSNKTLAIIHHTCWSCQLWSYFELGLGPMLFFDLNDVKDGIELLIMASRKKLENYMYSYESPSVFLFVMACWKNDKYSVSLISEVEDSNFARHCYQDAASFVSFCLV